MLVKGFVIYSSEHACVSCTAPAANNPEEGLRRQDGAVRGQPSLPLCLAAHSSVPF